MMNTSTSKMVQILRILISKYPVGQSVRMNILSWLFLHCDRALVQKLTRCPYYRFPQFVTCFPGLVNQHPGYFRDYFLKATIISPFFIINDW